jgi:hypothetical protein
MNEIAMIHTITALFIEFKDVIGLLDIWIRFPDSDYDMPSGFEKWFLFLLIHVSWCTSILQNTYL